MIKRLGGSLLYYILYIICLKVSPRRFKLKSALLECAIRYFYYIIRTRLKIRSSFNVVRFNAAIRTMNALEAPVAVVVGLLLYTVLI